MTKKQYDDDDGRRIADMSDLMPGRSMLGKSTAARREDDAEKKDTALSTLNKKEMRSVISSAVAAGLLVCGIFIAGAALLITICLLIW